MTVKSLFSFYAYEEGRLNNIYAFNKGLLFFNIKINNKPYLFYFIDKCSYLVSYVPEKYICNLTSISARAVFESLYKLGGLEIIEFSDDYKSFKFKECPYSALPQEDGILYDLTKDIVKEYKTARVSN